MPSVGRLGDCMIDIREARWLTPERVRGYAVLLCLASLGLLVDAWLKATGATGSDFLAFWEETLEGPLFSVTVAHSKLIKPAELRAVDGVFRLH